MTRLGGQRASSRKMVVLFANCERPARVELAPTAAVREYSSEPSASVAPIAPPQPPSPTNALAPAKFQPTGIPAETRHRGRVRHKSRGRTTSTTNELLHCSTGCGKTRRSSRVKVPAREPRTAARRDATSPALAPPSKPLGGVARPVLLAPLYNYPCMPGFLDRRGFVSDTRHLLASCD